MKLINFKNFQVSITHCFGGGMFIPVGLEFFNNGGYYFEVDLWLFNVLLSSTFYTKKYFKELKGKRL